MSRQPIVPVLVDPKMIDIVFSEIQTALTTKLAWLDGAYGKAQRLKRLKDDRQIVYPAIYTGTTQGKGYEDASPSDHFGNYCFFVTYDPEEIIMWNKINVDLRSQFGLIFWFDFRKIYPTDWQRRTIDNVKSEVVEFFRSTSFRNSQVTISRFYEDAENIYRTFTDKEIDNQFLMRPFGGFRIEGTVKYFAKDICSPSLNWNSPSSGFWQAP